MYPQELPLDVLLLDPNNYRLQEQEDFAQIDENRYHLDRVQNGTLERLKKETIRPLRESIKANGYLEIERIVVTPYDHDENKYLVIEGNRRVAALKQIRDEYINGIDISDSVVRVFDAVPCLVAENTGEDTFFREAIMGIRHVGGIKQWGGFQRAKLIADLYDHHELEPGQIAAKLGLTVQEVNRRYRAYRALQQMQKDEVYSEFATASMYPLFHEAVSLPAVREWLGWDASDYEFKIYENLEIFYQLITPREAPDGGEREPKIQSYSQVRQLREVLNNSDAKSELVHIDKEFADAVAIATQGNMVRRWRNEVAEARSALAKIPGQEIQSMTPEDKASIEALIEQANATLDMYKKLKSDG